MRDAANQGAVLSKSLITGIGPTPNLIFGEVKELADWMQPATRIVGATRFLAVQVVAKSDLVRGRNGRPSCVSRATTQNASDQQATESNTYA